MKTALCPICTGPMFVLPGEQPAESCTSCSEKPEGFCKAPGCGHKLREGTKNLTHGFCPDHFETAYACQWGRSKLCPDRAAADSPGRLCVVHGVHALVAAEKAGNPDGMKRSPWGSA